jgi:hypothetical protein
MVAEGTGGTTITNTASVTAEQLDSNHENNKDSASIDVLPPATYYIYLPIVSKNHVVPICRSYFDDFSDSKTGWAIDDSDNVHTGYSKKDEEYFIYRQEEGMRIAQAPTEFANLYSVEVDVHWGGANPGYEYGLVFGQTDFPVPTYRFGVDPVNRRFRIRRHNGSDWACINQSDPCWVRSLFIEPGSTSNHLKVECDGKGIGVYVNDNLLWQSNRNIPSCAGHVGVFAQSVTADTAVAYFDNFEVGCPTGEDSLNIRGRGQFSLPAVSAELEVDE